MTLLDDLGNTGSASPGPRRGRRGGRGKLVAGLLALVVVLVLVAGAALLLGSSVLDRFGGAADYPGPGTGSVGVEVPQGATLTSLAGQLETQDVVQSREAFLDAARGDERAPSLSPGTYQLRRQMSAAGALDLLFDPASRVQAQVAIPEGLEVDQVVERLVQQAGFSEDEVRAALADTASLGLPAYAQGNVEGFLFPATYALPPGTTAADVLQQMVARFNQEARRIDLEARSAALGMSPYDVVKVASLAQKEVLSREDSRKVARVVDNRIAAGIPLQFDSAINYILPEEERGNPNYEQLARESPYNLYLNRGLPPTPIDSPGSVALEAALDPAPGDWIYFITTGRDGTTLFTTDYQEFLDAKNRLKEQGPDAGSGTDVGTPAGG